MLDDFEYRLLRWAYSGTSEPLSGDVYKHQNKMQVLLGADIFDKVRDKTVIDFGCGYGDQTIELAQYGARRAIGLDIREDVLAVARSKASSLPNVDFFTPQECPRADADFVISLDSFEHFTDPCGALALMYELLAPGGALLVSFGPPWFHPLGGHSFSVFPWSHLLLSERALCRWYNETRNKKIARFEDVSGGLNRMTIASFENLVSAAAFSQASITPVPIRALRRLHNRLTREFTTSVVRGILKK